MEAGRKKLVRIEREDEHRGRREAVIDDRPALEELPEQHERAHDRRAHAARAQPGDERIGAEQRDDEAHRHAPRHAERLEDEPRERREHRDVQAADREQMQRAGAPKHFLHVLRRIAAAQAEHHAGDERGDVRRVFDIERELRIEPVPRADGEQLGARAVAVTFDHTVARVARGDFGINPLPSQIVWEIELPRIPHGFKVPGRSGQRHTVAVSGQRPGPCDVDELLANESAALTFQPLDLQPKPPRLLTRPKRERLRLSPHESRRPHHPRPIGEPLRQRAARLPAVAQRVQCGENKCRENPAYARARPWQHHRGNDQREHDQHAKRHRPPIRGTDPEHRRDGESEERQARAQLREVHHFPLPKGSGRWRVVVDTWRPRAKTDAVITTAPARDPTFNLQLPTPACSEQSNVSSSSSA